ncbi:MAG TPA: sterol desaturase family protein [Pyrinomonadaceae bacterium]|jgi:sterol desaturase/sphingolipid hydroxylase (fatty acid hydroxylase superfamily)
MLKPTVIAIPLFALLIAFETYFAVRKEENYDKKDVWTNIALGFGSVGFGFIFGVIQAFFYDWIYESVAPFKLPMDAWWTWTILLFVDDFAYYWFHRLSHEIRFFWNFHVVHHSSNQYNLSVAVRQSWFSGIAHWIFYLPAALMGFPLWAFVMMHGFNLIYQFWIHTKTIEKMPAWFEYIFNTPSHHRVHHGVNNPYLDKNYGGIFIFFDRVFGSFVEENETVRYGIIKPIESYNWLWINTHAWAETWDAMRAKKTVYGKLRCLFGAPAMDFDEKVLLTNIDKRI